MYRIDAHHFAFNAKPLRDAQEKKNAPEAHLHKAQ